jgi:hypothetical protein
MTYDEVCQAILDLTEDENEEEIVNLWEPYEHRNREDLVNEEMDGMLYALQAEFGKI